METILGYWVEQCVMNFEKRGEEANKLGIRCWKKLEWEAE